MTIYHLNPTPTPTAMKRSLVLFAFLAAIHGHGQEKIMKDVLRAKPRASGVIMKNNELAGYYSFYETDKVDSKNKAFTVALMDDNLTDVGSIRIVREKNSVLMESVFNGKAFMFFFLNGKNIELETYSSEGKKLGEKVYEDVSKWERMRAMMATSAGANGEVNQSIFPIGEEGFLKQSVTKGEKWGYQLTAYNNDLSVRWETEAPSSPMIESLDVIEVTEDHIIGSMFQQKNRMDQPDFTMLAMFDVHTGKKLWAKQLTQQGKNMSVLNVFPSETQDGMFVIGEIFGPSDKIFKDKSKGIFAMRMDMAGVPEQTELFSWEEDILPYVPADAKGRKELDRIFFHKVVRLKNGTVHCIGEEYKKVLGATGGTQITTKDMVVLELDSDLKLKGCEVVGKSKSRFEFPSQFMYLSPSVLAQLIKQMGLFDYAFTSQDRLADRYFASYVDFDRSKNESGDRVGTYIGTITGNGKDKSTVDKNDVMTKGTTFFRAYPAKAGYVMLYEYRAKLKEITLRLEKVNY